MDLKFDDVEKDTKLAKEYLEKNREFHSFGPHITDNMEASTQYLSNIHDYEIYHVSDLKSAIENVKTGNTGLSQSIWEFKFYELATKIEENIDLFIQLEYLLRNRPVEDSRLEIELLTKQFRCARDNNGYNVLTMSTGAPLLSLGCVASMRKSSYNIILATIDTAVISHLFTKMCHELGLCDFNLIITTEKCITEMRDIPHYKNLDYSKFTAANSWSLGVITEHSDVDSAVDIFIASSIQVQSPWKLRKILVQESVYQQFKDVLSWKCSLKGVRSDDEVSSSYRKLCPDVFKFDDRVFLLDYIRSSPLPQLLPEVTVEAYRTTKELLPMIRKYEPLYLSLWANDVAESNEVAHAVDCRVVWVNGFADFRGPPRISNVIYDITRTRFVKKTKEISELNKLTESWLKLDISERRKILSEVIMKRKELISESVDTTEKLDKLYNYESNGFVEVGKDYICMGITRPAGIVNITMQRDFLFHGSILESILLGNAFVTEEQDPLMKLYEEARVPAIYAELEDGQDCKVTTSGTDTVTKVVWANVGTIFAN